MVLPAVLWRTHLSLAALGGQSPATRWAPPVPPSRPRGGHAEHLLVEEWAWAALARQVDGALFWVHVHKLGKGWNCCAFGHNPAASLFLNHCILSASALLPPSCFYKESADFILQ